MQLFMLYYGHTIPCLVQITPIHNVDLLDVAVDCQDDHHEHQYYNWKYKILMKGQSVEESDSECDVCVCVTYRHK